jgi:hypothetical protein
MKTKKTLARPIGPPREAGIIWQSQQQKIGLKEKRTKPTKLFFY